MDIDDRPDPDDAEFARLISALEDQDDRRWPLAPGTAPEAARTALEALHDRRSSAKRDEDDVARAMGEDPDPPWTPLGLSEVDPDSVEGQALRNARFWTTPTSKVDCVTETMVRSLSDGTRVAYLADGAVMQLPDN